MTLTAIHVCTDDDVMGMFSCGKDQHFMIRFLPTVLTCDSCGSGRYVPSPVIWESGDDLYARVDLEEMNNHDRTFALDRWSKIVLDMNPHLR